MQGQGVLVVEDEFIIALELKSILEEMGARVVGPALTLADALPLASHEDISCAILDLRLGRDSIDPVAQALAARRIPFFFYSGQPPDDPIRVAWPQIRLLSKPATAKAIAEAVAATACS